VHELGSCVHCPADSVVGSAATDVPGQRIVYVCVVRVLIGGKQDRRCHDLTGLAVTALRNLLLQPSLLDRVTSIRRKALNRRNALSRGPRKQHLARAHGIAVENYGTGAALPDSAPIFSARQIQVIAQHPKKGCARVCVNKPLLAVNEKAGLGHDPFLRQNRYVSHGET
jgi:hypothetical protein